MVVSLTLDQGHWISPTEQDAIVWTIAVGTTGYLQKHSAKEQLLPTLREVLQGEFCIPGNAARCLVRSGPGDSVSEPLKALTQQEREVPKLFAQGLTYQEIGEVGNDSGLTGCNTVFRLFQPLPAPLRGQPHGPWRRSR